jgi:hypothetical protein
MADFPTDKIREIRDILQEIVSPAALAAGPKSQSQKVGQRPKKGAAAAPVPPPRKYSEGKRGSKHEDQFAVSATMSRQFRKRRLS